MKKILFLFLLFIPFTLFCQTKEEQHYIYSIVSFEGNFKKEDFKIYFDDGIEVKRLRNEKGSKMRFSTPAGALMYFIAQGWEMFLSGNTSEGASFQGTGATSTTSYWILRKPCTKEEFEKVVEASTKSGKKSVSDYNEYDFQNK